MAVKYSESLMDDLRNYLSYNPVTGVFTWVKDYHVNKVGYSPKPSHSEGYFRVQFKGCRMFLHRVAYYWVTGEQPDQVDHKDIDTSNNSFDNLRPATQKENACNRTPRGKSKFRGVTWYKNLNKWATTLRKDGEAYYLGTFDSELEAALAYNHKAQVLHGEFANLNSVFEDVSDEVLHNEL